MKRISQISLNKIIKKMITNLFDTNGGGGQLNCLFCWKKSFSFEANVALSELLLITHT